MWFDDPLAGRHPWYEASDEAWAQVVAIWYAAAVKREATDLVKREATDLAADG